MLKTVLAACVLLCALTINAEARQRHKAIGLHPECNVTMPCVAPSASTPDQVRVIRGRYIARQMGFGAAIERRAVRDSKARRSAASFEAAKINIAAQVVAHPSGCPSRAFCGCGAAVRVFGAPIRSLWLAANWFKFPRAAPAAGMVAVRRHHVFVLEAHLGGDTWQVYDANSGRRLTRIHARSIAGYVIVNPRAG
ncbi:hypothetical protein [Bradyrhizobium sp. JYMT SZCCT0428]|uniref:hypothetical protein n=1 Tax=Bradyrhizobium sp. JYMT SZCCT0428 TaxID=2807673 RepID=UPI0020136283|nr:hypothetical protein [Bradyrhizobium sp. JYMT SZCCT0428]